MRARRRARTSAELRMLGALANDDEDREPQDAHDEEKNPHGIKRFGQPAHDSCHAHVMPRHTSSPGDLESAPSPSPSRVSYPLYMLIMHM
jgi:hypothetical protein